LTTTSTNTPEQSGGWTAVDNGVNRNRWYHLLKRADFETDHQHRVLCGKVPGDLNAATWRYAYTLIPGIGAWKPRTCARCYHAWEAAQATQEETVHHASK
jgi:hypothetical protein